MKVILNPPHLFIKVKFILSSTSNGLLVWPVNHILISWNSELNVSKKIWFVGEISNKLPNILFGTKVQNILESCWYSLLASCNGLVLIQQPLNEAYFHCSYL